MAKIQELNLGLFQSLRQAWNENAEAFDDFNRDPGILEVLLLQDGGTQWYQAGGQTWFYIRNIIPGLGADFHLLSLDGIIDRREARDVIKDMMREYDLRRLTMSIPSPAAAMQALPLKLGFAKEGRLRDATVYGGSYTDVVVLGFHRSEVEDGKIALSPAARVDGREKKRRRRSRRSQKVTKASSASKEEA